MNTFREDGLRIVTDAIAADRRGEYERAYELYMSALEHLVAAVKYEKNDTAKKAIKERTLDYMRRAEELKESFRRRRPVAAAGSVPPRTPGSSGTGAEGGDGSGGAEEDPEKAKLKASLSGAIVMEKPNVKWDDVAGLDGAKDALKEAVILPAKFPQLFTGKRRPWAGILLYGPPGTGKSYLAKAVATEAAARFFSVSSSDLVSKWQGESERLVRSLFEMARESRPSIIFIDEIDSLATSRSEGESDSSRRIKTEFLVQMQGVGKTHDGILVLGATNTPWEIDAAMRRRFEKRVYIPLPELEARARIFKIHLGDTPSDLSEADYTDLGRRSEGFSGSDISVVVREALMEPLRKCRTAKFWSKDRSGLYSPITRDPPCHMCVPELSTAPAPRLTPCRHCGAERASLYEIPSEALKVPDVCMGDFLHVMERATVSVSAAELERFEKWTAEFGEEGS